MGRPSKLTDQRSDQILQLIRAGNYASQAAQAAGIGERTYYRWMKEGEAAAPICDAWEEAVEGWNALTDAQRLARQDERPDEKAAPTAGEIEKWQFWREVKRAEAEAEAGALLQIRKAASDGNWQAAAWYLERKFKARWGRNEKVTHEGAVDHRHSVQVLPHDEAAIEAGRQRLALVRGEVAETTGGSETPAAVGVRRGADAAPEVVDAEVIEEGD